MAVKADHEAGFAARSWRSAVQRSIDTVSEYADVAAQRIGAAADPRARLLRKRRWALRFGVSSPSRQRSGCW